MNIQDLLSKMDGDEVEVISRSQRLHFKEGFAAGFKAGADKMREMAMREAWKEDDWKTEANIRSLPVPEVE